MNGAHTDTLLFLHNRFSASNAAGASAPLPASNLWVDLAVDEA
jgi:hypothetical protein